MELRREPNHNAHNSGRKVSRVFDDAPSQSDIRDRLLTENHFPRAASKDSLRWTRPFTKLVSSMPYLGDVVVYQGLRGIYTARDKESLSKAMNGFQSRIFLLTVIHVGMAASIGWELNKDVSALSKGSIEKIPEIAFEGSLLAVFSAVTASQLILYRRVKNRVDRIKEREERLSVTRLSRPTNQSIILGLLLFLGSSVVFDQTIDKARPSRSKTPSGEVEAKSLKSSDKAK